MDIWISLVYWNESSVKYRPIRIFSRTWKMYNWSNILISNVFTWVYNPVAVFTTWRWYNVLSIRRSVIAGNFSVNWIFRFFSFAELEFVWILRSCLVARDCGIVISDQRKPLGNRNSEAHSESSIFLLKWDVRDMSDKMMCFQAFMKLFFIAKSLRRLLNSWRSN